MDVYSILTKELGVGKIKHEKDLFTSLTLRTHTIAEFYFEARSKVELINSISVCLANEISFTLIGGGSNIVFKSSRVMGLTIKNCYEKIQVMQEDEDTVDLLVSSGYIVSRLISSTVEKGWAGFEYHKGLPGTVGGAIFMNSKWMKPESYFGDCLIRADIIDLKGMVRTVARSYFKFAYDFSILQKTGERFIEGVFKMKKEDPEKLQRRADDALAYRKLTQPFGVATAGCFFRNISEDDKRRLHLKTTSSGYLIDQCGLKKYRIGDFEVSPIHANFIVNVGKHVSRSEDLIELVTYIKLKVKEKYHIDLIEEVAIT
ncbi:UDP-N-acetylenolpyruvoylglucosamine reductase [Candidatus Roizmanbacteria bacterium CG_4_10_14_0_8_um_filter_39_9]|uniref:UDP-N-acetylenolpyruvoylglucosamine reductase n=1 Tax=Candidatus Roizmanbacteria bacterium CG_4_10_14_0_8_um_filter_39_9 TaxID=1974829 RepID=A0A2M7QBI4_9BACT|nr:MAG: UDP-N-acetylenolpyruvoylglucosamine reductase [Candidatus Roizmanbacteria bacterium CG_4_10_14_0_8_um_filter_39_9]